MSDWNDEYKAKMREFMAIKGQPVEFYDPRFDWEDPQDCVSTYGWVDYSAARHCMQPSSRYPDPEAVGCHWVVPEGAVLTERTYSMFDNTFTDNKDEVGINVTPAHCACGKYTDVTLRFAGSLGEVIREITGTHYRGGITL